MKKQILLVIALFVVVLSLVIVVPASACTEGCTPGYWKQEQHFDSWVGYDQGDHFDAVFGIGPHMTLLDALKAKGGGENAFLRHAVAALLNQAAGLDTVPGSLFGPDGWVYYAYGNGGFEHVKDKLEGWNEMGCPLD